MVGDGINDSQALAQADVSIAMAKESDIAMDVAKMTLMTSDLARIPAAIQLSKKNSQDYQTKPILGINLQPDWNSYCSRFALSNQWLPVKSNESRSCMALSSISVVTNS